MRVAPPLSSVAGTLALMRPREERSGSVAARCQPLQSLAGSSVAGRFRTWTGRSGRRYVFSVYPLGPGPAADDTGIVSGDAVVIGVQKAADDTCVARFVAVTTGLPDFLAGGGLAALRGQPGGELHLHLTAADASERRRIAADLSAC